MAVFTQIVCGNCLEELKKIETETIDLVFADPPYWMRTGGVLQRVGGAAYSGCNDEWDNQFDSLEAYTAFTRQWLTECKRVLKPNGTIWVIGSMQCIYTIGSTLQQLGFWLINDVIWHKSNPTPNFHGTRLTNSHETLLWATKSQKAAYTFHYKTAKELNTDDVEPSDYAQGKRKQMGSVWKLPLCKGNERLKANDGKKLHSTQKPYTLLYRIITIASSPGDIVLDPFAGTFTTGAAAKQCGRSFIGIEISEQYCAAGQQRLDALTAESAGMIETAALDTKLPRVAFKALVQNGCFIPYEQFFFRGTDGSAILQPDGRLQLPDGTITDIHRGAALMQHKKAQRLNGYNFWYVERNGNRIPISTLRSQWCIQHCS